MYHLYRHTMKKYCPLTMCLPMTHQSPIPTMENMQIYVKRQLYGTFVSRTHFTLYLFLFFSSDTKKYNIKNY